MILENKRILFIAPKFYNYHSAIIQTMQHEGAHVTFFPEMHYSFIYRFICNISGCFKRKLEKKYLDTILKSVSENEYDLFFLIRGGIVTPYFLHTLKLKLPQASFLMYQWDSILQNNFASKIPYFDRVQTFDMLDAKALGLEYLPLFYTDEYTSSEKAKKKYDLVFFGSWHSDRLEIIKYFYNEFKKRGLSFKFHLYITKLAMLRALLLGKITFKDLFYLKTNMVSAEEITNAYKSSTAVLDIELAIQNGLTIRTFEVLGAKTKLVTTNNNIKDEKFYNPNNIMVIDRKNLKIDFDFFQLPMDEYDFSEYHICRWLHKILIKNN